MISIDFYVVRDNLISSSHPTPGTCPPGPWLHPWHPTTNVSPKHQLQVPTWWKESGWLNVRKKKDDKTSTLRRWFSEWFNIILMVMKVDPLWHWLPVYMLNFVAVPTNWRLRTGPLTKTGCEAWQAFSWSEIPSRYENPILLSTPPSNWSASARSATWVAKAKATASYCEAMNVGGSDAGCSKYGTKWPTGKRTRYVCIINNHTNVFCIEIVCGASLESKKLFLGADQRCLVKHCHVVIFVDFCFIKFDNSNALATSATAWLLSSQGSQQFCGSICQLLSMFCQGFCNHPNIRSCRTTGLLFQSHDPMIQWHGSTHGGCISNPAHHVEA